jgi:hypothetical protein
MLLDKEVNRRVNQMVNNCCHSENTTNNSHNLNEQRMPLFLVEDMQHRHRVGLVLEVHHGKLGQDHLVQACCVHVCLGAYVIVNYYLPCERHFVR